MRERHFAGALLALAVAATPVGAVPFGSPSRLSETARPAFPPYLQCVPYARQVSGVQIYGDAHTWWGQAEGRYAKGSMPKVGAVMAFKPSGASRLGHVAAVSRIIDERTVLISHANWSPINGRRGQIEKNVRAIDVSENNDWSEVRVWYGPLKALGGRHWPIAGFIYNEKPGVRGGKASKPAKAGMAESGKPRSFDEVKKRVSLGAASPARANPARDPIGAIIASD